MARTVKEEGELLLKLIEGAMTQDKASYPERLPPPLAQEQGGLLKALKASVAAKAEAIDLPVEGVGAQKGL